jgi:hypothetical protein
MGENGAARFVQYSNAGIQPQFQGNDWGMDMGYRVPLFDIEVTAQKQSPYSKMAQNELALQFFGAGFFNPQIADQALACLDMMDFNGKEEDIDKIKMNGTLMQAYMNLLQLALAMANAYDPSAVPMIAQGAASVGVNAPMPINQRGESAKMVKTDSQGNIQLDEHPFVANMRERVQASAQPR